ncbi:MAG: amidohydrolase family protein [Chloroflexota bacterium]|nr:amidohydrolase family protein [Chloroflexota bacterium]
MNAPALPASPPFTLRARLLTPLAAGGSWHETDALIAVDAAGRLSRVGAWDEAAATPSVLDIRPWVVLPGMVDLHAHLPQLPNAGLGAGLDLMTWLERYIFPLEREFDVETAERIAPAAFRAFARAGTTTVVAYGALWADSLDACFRAAEEHGIRAVIGKVMMDRLSYDTELDPAEVLELSLRQSADLCARWHGRDAGRLSYAYTPRFAVSCSAEMLRRSAAAAAETGAYWQTHLSEDRGEMSEVRRLFPEAVDYTDVYDRAGGLNRRAILAHAVHLSNREVERLAESGAVIAHCPSSNLFLASGAMPLARYLAAGIRIGLGSDVAAGPDALLFSVMRAGAYTQNGLRAAELSDAPPLSPAEWLRLGTLGGAEALGIGDQIGSVEVGKEADLIAVDPSVTLPLAGVGSQAEDGPDEMLSRLIFRAHPEMVRGAWVRGRLLPA